MAATTSNTKLTIAQMVDLSLNAPEVGVVNFSILHSLLHVIVNKLELADCQVEFRDKQSERLQNYISTTKIQPTITLTEYTVGPGGKGLRKKRKKDEKGKADEAETEKGSSDVTLVVIEPVSTEKSAQTPQFSVAVTKDYFAKLEEDILKLQTQVRELTELPGNAGLIEAIRTSSGKPSPVLDMFQILNLIKRLDATEAGMNKLGTMMEDLAKEHAMTASVEVKESPARAQSVKELYGKEQASKDQIHQSQQSHSSTGSKRISLIHKSEHRSGDAELLQHLEQRVDAIEASLEKRHSRLRTSVMTSEKGMNVEHLKSVAAAVESTPQPSLHTPQVPQHAPPTMPEPVGFQKSIDRVAPKDSRRSAGSSDDTANDVPVIATVQYLEALTREVEEVKELICKNDFTQLVKDVEELKTIIKGQVESSIELPPDVKIRQVESQFKECIEQLSALDTMFHEQIKLLDKRMMDMEKGRFAMQEKALLGSISKSGGDQQDGLQDQTLAELYAKIVQLQDKMVNVTDTASKLWEEKETRQNTIDVIVEQIEALKTVKANREDLEDALAEKADACLINRKVSFSQLEKACDELNTSIEQALERLKTQETLWSQALEDLQREIENKLDRMELEPLQAFINNKLKGLQDKLKSLATLKKEYEAAGTKSKILKDVNCISCDADVVMRKEVDPSMYPKKTPPPPSRNMGPYLAYELDQLRKQQKCVPGSKQPNTFEKAMQDLQSKDDHICNRYCGGSHTVTTAQQRVARMGHFMEQWGPEITPVEEGQIRGSDGQYYKAQEPQVKISGIKRRSKPSVSSSEKPEEPQVSVSKPVEKEERAPSKSTIQDDSKTRISTTKAAVSTTSKRPKTTIPETTTKKPTITKEGSIKKVASIKPGDPEVVNPVASLEAQSAEIAETPLALEEPTPSDQAPPETPAPTEGIETEQVETQEITE